MSIRRNTAAAALGCMATLAPLGALAQQAAEQESGSMLAEIVVTANSALYSGSGAPLDDLRSAVVTLGLQQVGAIAAAVSARALFEDQARAEYDLYPTLWQAAHLVT